MPSLRSVLPVRRLAAATAAATVIAAGLLALLAPRPAQALPPVEIRQRLALGPGVAGPAEVRPTVALTLDACGGGYDADLIDFLVSQRIPATVFATRRWINRNPAGLAQLLAHADLFEIEDHGAEHRPAVLGAGRRVYGLAGVRDVRGLTEEVEGGARAIAAVTGRAPTWYRGATAVYDAQAVDVIEHLGFRVAGFSLNADAGATLPRRAVAARVRAARDGDVILAHMNKPASDTAEGLMVALAELQGRGFRFVRLSDVPLVPPALAGL